VAPPAAATLLPRTVRVGLASDLDSVTLPCCDGEVTADADGTRLELASPVTVRPAAQGVSPAVWRLQVVAVRDEAPAADLARRLAQRTGLRADAKFDARSGLYRVRLGSWPSRAEAEAAARRLRTNGVDSAWAVSEGGGIATPALEVTHRGRVLRVPGRTFVVRAAPGSGLRVDGKRYRGALVVFLNDRGRLNLVNEVGLEDYLRGVVPRELGPGQYPEIEALKAQAVAARSYTLRNLGGFAEEGYDVCGTPQCQVYGGMDLEHPLSDRAVAATAGEVLVWGGQPIEALYSATCGGHTENVEVVFPLKNAPYLRGVPCIEAGGARLHAAPSGGAELRAVLLGRLLGADAAPVDAAGLERALRALATRAGVEPSEDHLRSLDRREVYRFLASLLDLVADARLFVHAEDLDYLVADPPADWSAEDRRFAAWLAASGLVGGGARGALAPGEAPEVLLRVALFLQAVTERSASFTAVRDGAVVVRENESDRPVPLEADTLTFRQQESGPEGGDLLLVPGDALTLYFVGGRLAALVQQIDPRGTAFDRVHERSSWTRFRTDDELAALVRVRYPGFALRGFEVLSRGVSGRVGKLRLDGAGGEAIELEGLAVRWTLDLPDTLFTAHRMTPPGGAAGWKFTGRGWGHGVGMCQTGAYGMARRGYDYRAILDHYYTGVTLTKLPAAPG
jgi:stage II sporulation protein D